MKALQYSRESIQIISYDLIQQAAIMDPIVVLMQTTILLKEKVSKWFSFNGSSPYMLLVSHIKNEKKLKVEEKKYKGLQKLYLKRSLIPAVTHVDYSARIQTLTKKNNLIYKLLKKFDEITKCPVLVNTSFNVKDEPIVCSPMDAYKCFMKTGLDILVLGNYIIDKKKSDIILK